MSFIQYAVIDSGGQIRIGFLEMDNVVDARTYLESAGVKEINTIAPSDISEDVFKHRKLYAFEATRNGLQATGTIEHTSAGSAMRKLEQDHDMNVTLISEPSPGRDRETLIAETKQLKASLQQAEHPPETSSVVDHQFQELLTEVRTDIEELSRDKEFEEEIEELRYIAETKAREAHSSPKEMFQTLRYLLRGLSYVEDQMDPSPLREKLGHTIKRIIALLKKVERITSNSAFGLKDEDMLTDFSHPLEERVLTEEEQAYFKKKEEVSKLQKELAAMEAEEDEEGSSMDIKLSTILLQEIPYLLDWLILFFMLLVVFSEAVVLALPALRIGDIDVHYLLTLFATSPLYMKTVLVLLLIWGFVKAAQLSKGRSGVVIGGLFGMIVAMYVVVFLL